MQVSPFLLHQSTYLTIALFPVPINLIVSHFLFLGFRIHLLPACGQRNLPEPHLSGPGVQGGAVVSPAKTPKEMNTKISRMDFFMFTSKNFPSDTMRNNFTNQRVGVAISSI